jgi:hypothetical protein
MVCLGLLSGRGRGARGERRLCVCTHPPPWHSLTHPLTPNIPPSTSAHSQVCISLLRPLQGCAAVCTSGRSDGALHPPSQEGVPDGPCKLQGGTEGGGS